MPKSPYNTARANKYEVLLKHIPEVSRETIETLLVGHADWTPSAPQRFAQFTRDCGAFMPWIATVHAEAIDIKDEELGFCI